MQVMRTATLTILTMISFLSCSYGQSRKDSLLVFVGEKIEVKYTPEEEKDSLIYPVINGKDTTYFKSVSLNFDSRYIAKYKILKLVHGYYKKDTIEFIVFDHYGEPAFSKFRHVLLFVSYYDGKLYHEKYQYFDVYMTKSGRWASPYTIYDYSHPFDDRVAIKPEKIMFDKKIVFPINDTNYSKYPKPYFEIRNGFAKPIYGNYIEDLYEFKLRTVLKARGIY